MGHPRNFPGKCACSACGAAPPLDAKEGWCAACWRAYQNERRALRRQGLPMVPGFAARRRAQLAVVVPVAARAVTAA